MPIYKPEHQIRAENRDAIYRVPGGIRIVPQPEPPKDQAMTTTEPTTVIRQPMLRGWMFAVILFAAAIATALVMLPGCKTVGTPVLNRVEREVNCLEGRLPQQAIAYLDIVTSCLATGDYMACLVPLAEKAGRDVIACAVAQAGSEAGARAASAGAGALPNQNAIAAHARAYLAADGAKAVIQ